MALHDNVLLIVMPKQVTSLEKGMLVPPTAIARRSSKGIFAMKRRGPTTIDLVFSLFKSKPRSMTQFKIVSMSSLALLIAAEILRLAMVIDL